MGGTALLVVANAAAGSADEQRLDAALEILRGGAERVDVVRTRDLDHLGQTLAELADRRLIVAGGDGSMHATVQQLWEAGTLDRTPLGLVPLGTGNDLATGLQLPSDPAEAARVCLDGRARELDLLVTDGGDVVVNASHAGLGAAAAERSHELKSRLGPLAYPLGALIAGVREAAWNLRVTVDGDVVSDGSTLMVGVANAPSIGGGTRLIPAAIPDDGLLDVIVVTAVTPAARLAFGAALRNAAHVDREDVVHVRGRSVTISGDEVAHDLDGELTEDLASCTYTVRPSAWRLLTP